MLYLAGGYLSSRKMIALVGSREPTSYAQKVIDYFVPALTHQGWSVVSGGARGVDTMVHRAALESGLTVAVIGSGLLQPYPSENKKLFDQLCHASGTMLSIFPLQAAPERWNFPARNRVIAGLSLATVVVQAAAKSGALITAHFALEQGRVVFAVPGSLFDQVSAGCHRLLKQGALLAESPEDLFEVIGSMVKRDDHAVSSCENVPQVNKSLFDSEQKIQDQAQEKISLDQNARNQTAQEKSEDLLLVHLEQELSVDELAFMTGQEVTAIQQRLFDLQLEGKIEQDFAGLWRIRKSKK